MDEITKDERFAHITKDPRFRTMSKKQRKVKIDQRFKSMFHDKRFKLKYSVDKRGKPMNVTTNENLKKYYELSDESQDGSDDEMDEEEELLAKLSKKSNFKKAESSVNKDTNTPVKATKLNKSADKVRKTDKSKKKNGEMVKNAKKQNASSDENSDNIDDKIDKTDNDIVGSDGSSDSDSCSGDDDNDDDPVDGENAPDYARGEGLIESSSDDEDDDEEQDDDEFDHQWGELDKNVPTADELSCRLAVCNMDWDRIKAEDLFVLFNSFKPAGGVIKSIRIYPSEFGLQRMREEQVHGPTELKELAKEVDVEAEVESEKEEEEEDSEGNRYHREKLRQYQLNRLKYYYAVVVCDSVETASKIYDECDGKEYESSSAKIDLRFIPDDMTFDHDPKSECFALPDASSYKSSLFYTSALCQSKVDLTWDETDQDRIKTTMRKYEKKGEVNEEDFKAYLASSDSEAEDVYGDLLAESDSEELLDEDKQIEKYKNLLKSIDETTDRKGDMEMEIEWEPGLKEATENVIKTKEKTKDQTPWESYLQQKKEKKKKKKDEQKKKRLAKKEAKMEKTFSDDDLPDGVDLSDNFFKDLNEPESKTSKKEKKKKKEVLTKEEEDIMKKEKAELALLMMDKEDDKRQHFSLNDLMEKKKKKKKKSKRESEPVNEDEFVIDLNDNRFDAVFKSHLFNIDPSAPEFKKTKGMEKIIEEKLKRRISDTKGEVKSKKLKTEPEESDNKKDELLPRREDSLSSLIKSVKAKTKHFQTKKKKK